MKGTRDMNMETRLWMIRAREMELKASRVSTEINQKHVLWRSLDRAAKFSTSPQMAVLIGRKTENGLKVGPMILAPSRGGYRQIMLGCCLCPALGQNVKRESAIWGETGKGERTYAMVYRSARRLERCNVA